MAYTDTWNAIALVIQSKLGDSQIGRACHYLLQKQFFVTPAAGYEGPDEAARIVDALCDMFLDNHFANGSEPKRIFLFFLVASRLLGKHPSNEDANDQIYNGKNKAPFYMLSGRINHDLEAWFDGSRSPLEFTIEHDRKARGPKVKVTEVDLRSCFGALAAGMYFDAQAAGLPDGPPRPAADSDLMAPMIHRPNAIPCRGTLLHLQGSESGASAILILPSRGGVYTDSLGLHMVGIEIPRSLGDVPGDIPLEIGASLWSMVSSQRVYLQLQEHRLSAGPIAGEPWCTPWAIAEHLHRLHTQLAVPDLYLKVPFRTVLSIMSPPCWSTVDALVIALPGIHEPRFYSSIAFAEDLREAIKSGSPGADATFFQALNHWSGVAWKKALQIYLPDHGYSTDSGFRDVAKWVDQNLSLLLR